MSKCNFTISFSGSAENVINKAKLAIQGQGGVFSGDTSSGTFSVQVLGSITGSYTISGGEMNVDIENKPLFISCSQIENILKNQLGS